MHNSILVTVPTLGKRPQQLRTCVASLLDFLPECRIEIRTPNVPEVTEILLPFLDQIDIVFDSSNQASCILNSWKASSESFLTWLNDDDIAILGVAVIQKIVDKLLMEATSNAPIVVYGDLGVMSETNFEFVKTPTKITFSLLVYGSNYVPGILTFINRQSLDILFALSETEKIMRNSFDRQWWLHLARMNAVFIHSNSCHAIWRKHEGARTQQETALSRKEDNELFLRYQNQVFIFKAIGKPLRLFYRLMARYFADRSR